MLLHCRANSFPGIHQVYAETVNMSSVDGYKICAFHQQTLLGKGTWTRIERDETGLMASTVEFYMSRDDEVARHAVCTYMAFTPLAI